MPLPRLETEFPNGRRYLIASAAVIAAFWLLVLPQIGGSLPVRAYIDRNEKLGIDPSVKFYTELPAMPALYDRIEMVNHRDPRAFWPHRAAAVESSTGGLDPRTR
jgi:hypothetical protein